MSDSPVVMSSTIPLAMFPALGRRYHVWNGSTAIEGLVGNVQIAVSGAAARTLRFGAFEGHRYAIGTHLGERYS